MRALLSALLIAAVATTGCTGDTGDPFPPGTSAGFGESGFTSGNGGTTEGSGGDGRTSLDGARAFTVWNGTAADERDGGQISLDDGPPGCNPQDNGASRAVRILLPTKLGIGNYGVGPEVDGGAAVEFFDFGLRTQGPLLTALSGSVYVNRADPQGVGGNFDVVLGYPDGGIDSELAGIFGATPCF